MVGSPSVLLVDDGELDTFEEVLVALGADHVRLRGPAADGARLRARDVLVTSFPRALGGVKPEPAEPGMAPPIWIVVHWQDFLPLRARLRRQGVHYLVHTAAEAEALRVLLEDLLFDGKEQRADERMPVAAATRFRCGLGELRAKLLEISASGARILTSRAPPRGEQITLMLPQQIDGATVSLPAEVVRCSKHANESNEPAYVVAVRFGRLNAKTQVQLERVVSGELPGMSVTMLNPPRARRADAAAGARIERRRSPRHPYGEEVRTVDSLCLRAAARIRAHDLSLHGARIDPRPGLEVGARLALALQGPDGAPLVLEACVARDCGEEGLGIEFDPMPAAAREALRQILEQLQQRAERDEDAQLLTRSGLEGPGTRTSATLTRGGTRSRR